MKATPWKSLMINQAAMKRWWIDFNTQTRMWDVFTHEQWSTGNYRIAYIASFENDHEAQLAVKAVNKEMKPA